jgi:hypothetical protein
VCTHERRFRLPRWRAAGLRLLAASRRPGLSSLAGAAGILLAAATLLQARVDFQQAYREIMLLAGLI